MRKTIFVALVLLGCAAGLLASMKDDWATRVVLSMIGALVGAAVGGALTHRSGTKGRSELDDSIPGMGTSTADIAANYWRDRGQPPLMKPPLRPPDHHIHDPDRLA